MESDTIRYKVDLVVQLLDTTTGRAIEERDVRFTKDDADLSLGRKGDGNFISVNTGREDFSLGVYVKGYEESVVDVSYDNLDKVLPVLAVYLIPQDVIQPGAPLLTLKGKLDGITSIEGVCLSNVCCNIQSFDERKRIMQIFKSNGNSGMSHVNYGLISKDEESYEGFEILKEISSTSIKIKKPLENSYFTNQSICRVVCGKVFDDGTYVLRTRDDRTDIRFIVKYTVGDEIKFMKVDFHDTGNMELI